MPALDLFCSLVIMLKNSRLKLCMFVNVCLLITGCFLRTMLEPSGGAYPPEYKGLCLGSFVLTYFSKMFFLP